MKNKASKLVLMILYCVSAASFADGFGVAGADNSGAAQSVNQLLGSPQAAGTQDGPGTLSMSKVQAILQATNAQNTAQTQAAQQTQPVQDSSLGNTGLNQEAFANMAKTVMPLSPDQVQILHNEFDNTQKAVATYPNGPPPKPTSSSVIVNLSPGAVPPVVRLRSGYVTSLVFLDSTGQPWPVHAYDIGDPTSFNVVWDQKGNTLLVQSSTTYKSGNLAVMLTGQNTPVMITLMPGQRAVDYRVDLRVPGFGPNAAPQMSSLPDMANPELLNFLNGIPPQGAIAVTVDGAPCEGWIFAGHLYLRTLLTVLSPGWLTSMSSPDGTHVYELNKTPVVLASYNGQVTQLTIEGL